MRPGDVIAERFALETLVGVGGMGSVFRAHDRHTDEVCAVKVMRDRGDGASVRFFLEARVLAELRHPAIVRYISHGTTPAGEHYLAMEWLEGQSLAERLEDGPLPVRDVVALAQRVAEALAAAHALGVVHRDIKPSNLFLSGGRGDRVKVLDFGVARLGQSVSAHTGQGRRVGTPRYMAPEQVRGDRELDASVDVFALGCVLYQALTGRHAFGGDDELAVLAKILLEDPPELAALRPETPPGLVHLVGRMLAKESLARPPNGAAVVAELGELTSDTQAAGGGGDDGPTLRDSEKRVLSVVLAAPGVPLAAARDVALRHGGRLEELAGGAAAVVLTGGRSARDQAAQAARLALALAKHSRVALATGLGVVSRRQPAGEVIDRAAALLRAPAPTRGAARIDDVTAGLLDGSFELRGGELVGESVEGDPVRTLLGKVTPFVGRDRELGMLETVFEESVADRVCRAVLVTASPGMGKSRLRRELTRRALELHSGTRVLFGRGDPMRAGSPFSLIAPAIRAALDVVDGDAVEAQARRLGARVAEHVAPAEVERVAEFLGELVGVPFPDAGRVQLRAARQDPMLMGDQMRRAWEDWLAALGARGPVLLVLEDVHYGDLPSVKFVDAALRNVHGPFMVLALARPEVHAMFPGLWAERALTETRLGELSRRAAESLIRAALGQVDQATRARLVERAGGNALYLEELIRAVADGTSDTLPETVLAMVQSRVEGFPAEARRLLRAGSVLGETFWLGAVAAIVGDAFDEPEAREWLAVLADKEVLGRRHASKFRGEEEYGFRHALVREAAYAAWTDGDRRRAHRAAAVWLEGRGESDAMLLALHFERGGEPRRAIGWYRRAAEQALEGNDFAAAVARAELGIACGATGAVEAALRLIAAEAQRWRGGLDEVVRQARAALAIAPPGEPLWCHAIATLALAAGKVADRRTVHTLARAVAGLDVEQRAAAGGPFAIAVARLYTSALLLGLGDEAAALAPTLELDGAARARFGPAVCARVDVARSVAAANAGDVSGYLRLSESAVGGYEQAGDLRSALGPRINVGFAFTELGLHAEAERVLREALATSQRLGVASVTGSALQNLGWALAGLGRLDEARAVESEAVELYRVQGARYCEGAARLYLGRILAASGDLDGAETQLARAVDILGVAPPLRVYAQAALAEVNLRAGRKARALELASDAAASLASLGEITEGESFVRLVHADALASAGRSGEARAALAAARERLLARAGKISDRDLRERFLTMVPENAATLRG